MFAPLVGMPATIYAKPSVDLYTEVIDPDLTFKTRDEGNEYIAKNKKSLPEGTFLLSSAVHPEFRLAHHVTRITQDRTFEYATPTGRTLYEKAKQLELPLCFRYAAEKPATEQPAGSVCVHVIEDGAFNWKIGGFEYKPHGF